MGAKLQAAGAKLPRIYCVNWFRKGADGKFVWPGYGENMRVLKWMLERVEGRATGVEHAFGISPRYEDLSWDGLPFTRAQFDTVTSIGRRCVATRTAIAQRAVRAAGGAIARATAEHQGAVRAPSRGLTRQSCAHPTAAAA